MTATVKTLVSCLAVAFAALAAGHLPAAWGPLVGSLVVGDMAQRRHAEELLRQARRAMDEGAFDQAESYLQQAERLDVARDRLFTPFQDTPEKLRRELAERRSAPRGGGAVTPIADRPSSRFVPRLLDGGSSAAPARPDPFQARGGGDVAAALTGPQSDKDAARQYLERGRAALAHGDTLGAINWYRRAAELPVTFAPGEYSPQQLAAELQRAGVQLSQLEAPRNAQTPFPVNPLELENTYTTADRIPGFGNAVEHRFTDAVRPEVVANRYADSSSGGAPAYAQPSQWRQFDDSPRPGGYGTSPAGGGYADRGSESRSLSPELAQRRQHALALLSQSRAALDRYDLTTARRLAMQARELNLPDSAYGPRDERPDHLLMEIDRAERSGAGPRRDDGVIRAGGYASLSDGDGQGRWPVSPGVYDPQRDPTRNAPAAYAQDPGRLPENPADAGMRWYRLGEQALADRDLHTAMDHFRKAWQYEQQLDPTTRQRLQDHLQMLRISTSGPPESAPPPAALGSGSPAQQELLRNLLSEINREQAAANQMRQQNPRGARDKLTALRERVAQANLEADARRQLLHRVDRSLDEINRYIAENRHQIELDQQNQRVLEDIERDQLMKLQIQDRIALLTDEFNRLMDEQRWEEAEVIAKQVRELDPHSEIAQMLTWKARFVRRWQMQMALKDRKEEAVWATLQDVEESAVPFPDSNPYVLPDVRTWQMLSDRRRRLLRDRTTRLTEEERQIQEALKIKVDVRFQNRPLAEVLDTLAKAVGVNMYLDPEGLAAEGVSSDTPVTINLTQPISLRSALNHILQPLHLSYVIQDEVLKITSEQVRDANVFTVAYDVADLVIPIPNFVPSYEIGLPGAIRAAQNAQLMTGMSGGIASAPLAVIAGSEGMGSPNASVLAQMNAAGMIPSGSRSRVPQPIGFGPGGMGGGSAADFDTLIDLITSTIAPTTWDDVGGPGSIAGFDTNLSLVVSQTQEVHDEIVDLLEQLRRLQDLQVTIEVRFITLRDDFFERIGVNFDLHIDDNVTDPNFDPAVDRDTGPSLTIGLGPTGSPTADLDLQFNQGGGPGNVNIPAAPIFGGFDVGTAANFGFAILSDIEAYFVMQAAQGDRRTNILQAPKVTLFNGQQAYVSDTSQRPFVTSIVPVVGDFAAAHQPIITVLNEGTSLSVQAVVSPDRRFVRLTLVPFFSSIGDVQEFTFTGRTTTNTGTAVIDPVDDRRATRNQEERVTEGSTVQLPTFNFVTVTTTVSVPDGGTVLLGGIKRLREERVERGVPVMSKIPYINRLFRNVGIGRETQSLMMMVTPRIIIQEEEEEKLGLAPPP